MSNVIVLDSSDEEEPPAKKIKSNIMPSKQKLPTINRKIIQEQQQQQPFKKIQNSIQITPIYNNNSNNTNNCATAKNNQNINTGLIKNLDKLNSISINSIGGGMNKIPQTTINSSPKSQLIINNNNININRTNSPINELNALKTMRVNNNIINNSTIPINLPNSLRNTITVNRINSPQTQANINSPKSISPTIGITKKCINIQQRKKELLIDPLKNTNINKFNQQKNILINNNNNNGNNNNNNGNNNNNNNDKVITSVSKMPLKRKAPEKTNFEKNLELQIAQRQQKPQQSPQIKRIKPITISNKIDSQNWLNKQSPVITIDDDDDNDDDDVVAAKVNSPNSLQSSPKPFTVKLNNSYIQTISSPLESITNTKSISPNYSKPSATITTKSITHTITSPIEISTNKNDTTNIIKNVQITSSSTSTTPNSKIQDENNDVIEKNPMTPAYEELLNVCRKADPSNDMEKLIEKKLLKYYHSVHPDFVTSKGFRKTIELTIAEIKNTPELVYLKIKTIVEELKTRKNSKQTIVNNEDHTTTGNSKTDNQVKKLSRGLYKLQMIIKKLEEDDVDWDNDSNSPYLKVERFKKRACEIYEKICDLTGESKHAHRLVSKPISFQGTSYPPFNKTIQTFVNRTKSFPDYLDVYRLLEFCNKQNSWEMSPIEMKAIAQDAFVKIGKLLQKRRQTDLYETVIHFTGDAVDPAENDTELNTKLNENLKHVTKISSILEKFSKQQDIEAAEKQKTKDEKNNEENQDEKSSEKSDNENDENKIIKLNELEPTRTIALTTTTTSTTTAKLPIRSISLIENDLNPDTINNNKLINSIQNPQPSTSKSLSDIKIHSVQSLKNNNCIYNNHNIVGEIVLSDDDDET